MGEIENVLRRQQEHIDHVGWSVTMVIPTVDDPGTPFAYTVGLTGHNHPELVIAGLSPRISHTLLNDLATRVVRGERFAHAQRINDLLVEYDAVIVSGPATEALYPGTAYARYGSRRVRLQQIVWPDPTGHFPWEAGYTYPADVQPIIGRP